MGDLSSEAAVITGSKEGVQFPLLRSARLGDCRLNIALYSAAETHTALSVCDATLLWREGCVHCTTQTLTMLSVQGTATAGSMSGRAER